MGLPAIIKVKGYRLVRNDSYDEPIYSVVLEAKAKSLSTAITKCMGKAKHIEKLIKDTYGLIYYGFDVLTQFREMDEWHAVIRVDYIPEDLNGDENYEEYERTFSDDAETHSKEPYTSQDTDLMESFMILNIVDELEMVLLKPPLLKDVVNTAKEIGITNPFLKIFQLSKKGLIKMENGRISRNL